MTPDEIQQFRAARKAAGLKIDPQTAEVDWAYGQIMGPYGLEPDLPDELDCVGRVYFARSPGSDEWVEFCDLPEATRDALVATHRRKLAFPAELPLVKPSELRRPRL